MSKRYLICCEIMRYEVEYLLEQLNAEGRRGELEVHFLRKGFHENPAQLRAEVQKAIDAAPADTELILLGYGLCGKGLEGVTARDIPLVISRVHDCISILLGSAQAYAEHFNSHPGTYYYSPGWVEWGKDVVDRPPSQGFGLGKSYEEYVAQYGEDNARYLMELEASWAQNYSRAAYIDAGVLGGDWEAKAQEIAAANKLTFERVPGSLRLLRLLLAGPWDADEFLTVPPGQTLQASNDATILACRS